MSEAFSSMEREDGPAHPTVGDILGPAKDIGNIDITHYRFVEDEESMGGNDRFVLSESTGSSPMFFFRGKIIGLNTTPSLAVSSRRRNRTVYIDDYTTCIEAESSNYSQDVRYNLEKMLQLLSTDSNLRTIAFESGMVRHRNDFELLQSEIDIKFANVGATGIFYLNRKVAAKDIGHSLRPNSIPPEMLLLPQTGPELHKLIFPTHGFKYLQMIPVLDNEYCPVLPQSYFIPRSGKAFFEIRQGSYNYAKGKEKIQEIVLIPTIVACILDPLSEEILVEPPVKKLKRGRVSF